MSHPSGNARSFLVLQKNVRLEVAKERTTTGFTLEEATEQVERAFGGVGDPFIQGLACIDGRTRESIFGSPGGDIGEFLLGLTIYARHCERGESIGKKEVHLILLKYLTDEPQFHGFYMHTAQGQIKMIAEALSLSEAEVIHPKPENRDKVVGCLIDPKFMGCGHLAQTILRPDEYKVPNRLSVSLIDSFHRLLWPTEGDLCGTEGVKKNPPHMNLVVVQGCHEENAIILVHNEKETMQSEFNPKYPLVHPNFQDKQVFLSSPEAVHAVRFKIAKFFAALLNKPELDPRKLFEEMNQLAGEQLALTVGVLAPTLPIYNAFVKWGEDTTEPLQTTAAAS